jgi:hypothetical protein
MMRVARWLSFVLVCACEDKTLPDATFDELCGAPEPVMLLSLEPGEVRWARRVRRVGERILVEVSSGTVDEPTLVYSVGPCGESPHVLARNVTNLREHEQFPGVVFGCDRGEPGGVVVVDPEGSVPTRPVFTAHACNGRWTPHGIVSQARDNGDYRLLFEPYPSDLDGPPLEPIMLLEDVRAWPPSVAVRNDEVLAIDGQGDLVRVGLPDGDVTLEQRGVERFILSTDGRFLGFIGEHEVIDESMLHFRGDMVLRDRFEGRQVELTDVITGWSLDVGGDHYARVWRGAEVMEGTRLIELETMTVIEYPDDRVPVHKTRDGRWLAMTWPGKDLLLHDMITGEATRLPSWSKRNCNPYQWSLDPDGFELIDRHGLAGPLRRFDYATATAELLARRVAYGHAPLVDGRIVTGHRFENPVELLLVDPESLHEWLIEPTAIRQALQVEPDIGHGERLVLYGVADEERSGLWLARLAPLDTGADAVHAGSWQQASMLWPSGSKTKAP